MENIPLFPSDDDVGPELVLPPDDEGGELAPRLAAVFGALRKRPAGKAGRAPTKKPATSKTNPGEGVVLLKTAHLTQGS
eukprot:9407786-Lingulodinium_polyedra.AAC.1